MSPARLISKRAALRNDTHTGRTVLMVTQAVTKRGQQLVNVGQGTESAQHSWIHKHTPQILENKTWPDHVCPATTASSERSPRVWSHGMCLTGVLINRSGVSLVLNTGQCASTTALDHCHLMWSSCLHNFRCL